MELKRAFQDQLRRELGARAGDIHSTLGDRRVARAPSRKMTAAGAPGAQYILDGDVRARQTLEPALGLPQLTAVKLATFADDVESRVGREKQSADWAASADAASGAPGLTKPDVKLGAGGSGGGARAFRFRKAMYARRSAPGNAGRAARASSFPRRAGTTIAFPGGDAFGSRARPRASGRFPAASGARGKHKPRVSAPDRDRAFRCADAQIAPRLKPRRRREPFPNSANAVAADAPGPSRSPDAPSEKKGARGLLSAGPGLEARRAAARARGGSARRARALAARWRRRPAGLPPRRGADRLAMEAPRRALCVWRRFGRV